MEVYLGGFVTLDQGVRGLAVLGIVAVADAIGLAAMGILNAYKIVELQLAAQPMPSAGWPS